MYMCVKENLNASRLKFTFKVLIIKNKRRALSLDLKRINLTSPFPGALGIVFNFFVFEIEGNPLWQHWVFICLLMSCFVDDWLIRLQGCKFVPCFFWFYSYISPVRGKNDSHGVYGQNKRVSLLRECLGPFWIRTLVYIIYPEAAQHLPSR